MPISTQAIVLSAIKYADADLIVTCYTKTDGIKTYHVRGVLKSRRGKFKASSFLPFTQLEIVARHRNKGTMEYLNETKISVPYTTLHTDVIKSSLVMFLSEVLKSVIREEEANPALFNFLQTALIDMDKRENVGNFHIYFLLALSRYLGFFPDANSQGEYFNMLEGVFQNTKTNAYCVQNQASASLFSVLDNLEGIHELPISKTLRKELLTLLLTYYQLHVEGFRQPRSLKILEQLFR